YRYFNDPDLPPVIAPKEWVEEIRATLPELPWIQGSMRCDANVSLRPVGTVEFGTRTETKNINSLKSVEQAVRYEMQRQAQVLEDGGEIVQETRHYQETDGSTSKGRPKETAEDYRYFNDPDLPPVIAPKEWVEEIRATLPELPWI
ncbi:hypothetical protein EKL28_16510, partial [Staphylococcus aureus]